MAVNDPGDICVNGPTVAALSLVEAILRQGGQDMRRYIASICFVMALTVPTAAFAYVGPGAGLGLLGALWALVAALATALSFIIAWPFRKALRRRRASRGMGPTEKRPDRADHEGSSEEPSG